MLCISTKELLINEEIREKEVRVISSGGEQVGIFPINQALDMAAEEDLDLVMISPNGKPPVCRIMDYGKYRFELAKKEKDARKNQKIVELKEIRMSLNIDTHDLNTKVKTAVKFLKSGHKVKVTIRFRKAREMSHMNLSVDLMNKFKDLVAEHGTPDKPSKLEGRNYSMILSPITNK